MDKVSGATIRLNSLIQLIKGYLQRAQSVFRMVGTPRWQAVTAYELQPELNRTRSSHPAAIDRGDPRLGFGRWIAHFVVEVGQAAFGPQAVHCEESEAQEGGGASA